MWAQMILREKQDAMLSDLLEERACANLPFWWLARLDEKIAELRAAMGDENA